MPRRAAAERMRFAMKAEYDSVTGLFNRATVKELVTGSWRETQRIAGGGSWPLISIILSAINDTYGHLCGDGLLRKVGALARRGLPQTDIVGRIGATNCVYLCSIPAWSWQRKRCGKRFCPDSGLPEKMGWETTVSISIASRG